MNHQEGVQVKKPLAGWEPRPVLQVDTCPELAAGSHWGHGRKGVPSVLSVCLGKEKACWRHSCCFLSPKACLSQAGHRIALSGKAGQEGCLAFHPTVLLPLPPPV